ncbi:MAG: CoA ester lyase [Hyphomicrobiales bacterium]|nr:CoA ester lyase [Hyphomicrobiales bacterium]MCY4052574.1 CoA ester lyase [Hyphomicrobiales bacterium]
MNFRSMLFTPATRLDRVEKALDAAPDWVAIDLEDGVGLGDKDDARDALGALAASGLGGNAARIALRINTPASTHGIKDVAALLEWSNWPALLILPKVEAAAQVRQLAGIIRELGKDTRIMAVFETARGIANANCIAESLQNGANDVAVVGYGSADHMAEVGGEMTPPSLASGRAAVLNAAAILGVPALDGVRMQLRDEEGLIADAMLGKEMGFAGKIAIHPAQVAPINKVFSPSGQEIAEAHALIEAAEQAGGGAFSFQGKMVDPPLLARALRITQSE